MQQTGLYHPSFEHDACGIGFIANIKGNPTHNIINESIEMLHRLDHRAGYTDDTSDGAGILVQIPDAYFRLNTSFDLPAKGDYGVGMFFLPQEERERLYIEKLIEEQVADSPLKWIGWREVPVNPEGIGRQAEQSRPIIKQLFVGKDSYVNSLTFDRQLFVLRKRIEKQTQQFSDFYIVSFSSQTIVYKGLLKPMEIPEFYQELADSEFRSAFGLVHARYSTNTEPMWKRAHPYRYLVHNGEINTLRGNINAMKAREGKMASDVFGVPLETLLPIIDESGSDSASFDNVLEFLSLSGRSLANVATMLVPEPWELQSMDKKVRDYYKFHSQLMEPWDGPMAISFTNGKQIGTLLDRNGLRPGRYIVTHEDKIVFSSEFGVLDVPDDQIKIKKNLSPGEALWIDLEEGRICSNEELKKELADERPYGDWLKESTLSFENVITKDDEIPVMKQEERRQLQKAFGYTYEELIKGLMPMATEGKDPVGSMGTDTPIAVLSDQPQLLYNYFKQLFAQVTNPAIDAIREASVTSGLTWLGAQSNLLETYGAGADRVQLNSPIIETTLYQNLLGQERFKARIMDILFDTKEETLERAMDKLFDKVDAAIEEGVVFIVLSDMGVNETFAPIPALLAVAGLHHHLIRQGTRMDVSIIVNTGEARDVHHMAMLVGYGADVIHPILGIETIKGLIDEGHIKDMTPEAAVDAYLNTLSSGVIKVMSKLGISTVQSYRGAQMFEALGLSDKVVARYFTGTASQIGGIGLDVIAEESLMRHTKAFKSVDKTLDSGSQFQWRHGGEYHKLHSKTIYSLQQSTRRKDYQLFKTYSALANTEALSSIRNLVDFKANRTPISIDEVESIDAICRRFKTGAMSYGSISKEAHEALAIAMNRIGGKSNSGEGGEDPKRYILDANGDNRKSAIKQVASGRFGVTSYYLANAEEIQIKLAQGAKPGEGGHLPGKKVYPWIAEVRGSTPGVGLISPPPHHDIYSIEDLAQLIYDLKHANPNARINVKLVAKAGVGTIAAGVAKGLADVILISGSDGGTGASPRSSIQHAGLPWELGLAEAHQTLVLNGLRDRVTLETDGKLMTGRDVVMAAILGAEEYGFSTAPLVVLGCVMMRVCQSNTCPVGIATQDPELRKRFAGTPDHVVTFMHFVAQEVRELLAELGFRSLNELIGRTDLLEVTETAKTHWKAKHLDLSKVLTVIEAPEGVGTFKQRDQDHKLEESFDIRELLDDCRPALELGHKVVGHYTIKNTDRTVTAIIGNAISNKYGAKGLPEDTIHLHFRGTAGQSFGAFAPHGITLELDGDANDYVGKGLSGGKIIVRSTVPEAIHDESSLIGNVAFYGASSGEAYINGRAGERFGVRNSGVKVVVEGIGNHGCEYMTGGRVVNLGSVGSNFAAGMSGGIAYILSDESKETFKEKCNLGMVLLEALVDPEEIAEVKHMIEKHVTYTNSAKGREVLSHWEASVQRIIKVIPSDYKRMLANIDEAKAKGLHGQAAILSAFEKKTDQKVIFKDDALEPV
ncbi:glutamate synthase (NADPH/NADH) large chain [Pullulanibacillus pueri]|uniref:Glutamate synthase [NADPH] large chain n=1 Tax=Pullulanibacillus pueri TaxID=1437324 RepID=A0A8J2ZSG1_9BACL|nr:glutamate synthase large subunit [Pullulanibacillus pueri]MBM7680372.1 glutamate synthase (NADPH/NADH) large chain [Pullulanibacillus pueri]GGH75397.1 glutamate synthase [NADPH] large chain [Pullulanibacillus pueri]